VAVLFAAAEWGCPPWEIAGGSKTEWLLRWQFLKEQQGKAAEVERKKWEARRKRG